MEMFHTGDEAVMPDDKAEATQATTSAVPGAVGINITIAQDISHAHIHIRVHARTHTHKHTHNNSSFWSD